jgi:chemotaxis protein methyltransferase CheR
MDKFLNHFQLSQMSELIAAKMGLHFPQARWYELERGLVSAAAAGGFADASVYCHSLLSTAMAPSQIEELSTYLTVGETYFFREKPAFNALREHVLPELIRARRASTKQLRIWSAGCCTGEEAYSTAILLNQLLPDYHGWVLNLLATDINPHFLRKAEEGVYGEWSFRDIPPNIKERYFTQSAKGRFEIHPSIKQQVSFALLNLAEASYPAYPYHTNAMDLILCRNVLMYFTPEQAKRVVRKLYNSLTEGGWLVVSLGEASHLLFADFKAVNFPNAILYQKQRVSRTHEKHFENPFADLLTEHLENRPQGCWREQSALFASHEIPHLWHVRDNRLFSLHQPQRSNTLRPAHPQSATTAKVWAAPPHEAKVGAVPLHETNGQESNGQAPKSQLIYEQGDYLKAEAQVHLELAETPEDAAALLLLARICANQGRLDEALEWAKRSLAADRLNLRGHHLYATIQEERGEINEAIIALKRALYLHPEFVLAHFSLGSLARRQGKQAEAQKHFSNMFALLKQYQPEEILPESDGLTAGRLAEMVRSSASLSSPAGSSPVVASSPAGPSPVVASSPAGPSPLRPA